MNKKTTRYPFWKRKVLNFSRWFSDIVEQRIIQDIPEHALDEEEQKISRSEFLNDWDHFMQVRYGKEWERIKKLSPDQINAVEDFVRLIMQYLVDIGIWAHQEGVKNPEIARDKSMEESGIQKAVYEIDHIWKMHKERAGILQIEEEAENDQEV